MKNCRIVYKGDWTVAIRKDFILNPTLSIGTKMLYIALKSYCGPEMSAFPSAKTLATGLGLNRETVYKYAAELEKAGLLKREQSHEAGKFSHTVYNLFTTDVLSNSIQQPQPGKPCTEKPATAETVANCKPIELQLIPEGKEKTGSKDETQRQPTAVKLQEPEEVTEWNKCSMLPKILALSPKRLSDLKIRRRDPFFAANWKIAIQKCCKSQFCIGVNDRGWRATFDWLLRPDSVLRIMEGKYDRAEQVKQPTHFNGF